MSPHTECKSCAEIFFKTILGTVGRNASLEQQFLFHQEASLVCQQVKAAAVRVKNRCLMRTDLFVALHSPYELKVCDQTGNNHIIVF